MRDDDRHLRIAQRDRVQVERVAEADVEQARQPQLPSRPPTTHPVDEHLPCPACRGDRRDAGALALNRVVMHRSKTHRAAAVRVERCRAVDAASGLVGSTMKKPTNRSRCRLTATATDAASPGMLAINAARDT
jgi:hypothetical protein